MGWEILITPTVLIFLGLFVWARMTKQTVGEVIKDIKDILRGGAEDTEEAVEGVIMYE